MKTSTRFHQRLGVQLGVTVALVTGLAFAVTVATFVRAERATLTRELTLRLLNESRSLALGATGPLLRHDPELGLHPLIVRALDETPDLVDLVVLDVHRRIQGHRDMLRVGTTLQPPRNRVRLNVEGLEHELVWLDGDVLVIECPIQHFERTVGWVVMHASRDQIEATVREAQEKLAALGGLGTLVAILAVTVLVRINLRPLGALRWGVQQIGAGDLRARIRVGSRNELGMLANLINSMAMNLERAQTELVQKERLDREIEIARQLQSMLLPRVIRPAPGYELETHYSPALEVSGDYYDVLPLDEHHLGLIAADVSGKGVPGLVLMSMLRTTLRGLAAPHCNPVEVLVAASRMLADSMRPGMFITCLYGVLDSRTHVFEYTSAGHCAPIAYGPRGVHALPARGKPLGLFKTEQLRSSLVPRRFTFEPGDGLLLYTDGLVEAMNDKGELLGQDALLQRLKQTERASAESVVANVLKRVREHRGRTPVSDDLTLMALQRQTASAAPRPRADYTRPKRVSLG